MLKRFAVFEFVNFDPSPIADASLALQVHLASAVASLALIPVVLWRTRKDRWHKNLGYIWVSAMIATAISSFWISNFPMFLSFSPLHALSVLTLVTVVIAVWAAINRKFRLHERSLKNLATYGLGIPAILNFLPDRTLTQTFFAQSPATGLILSGSLIALILLWRSGLWAKMFKRHKSAKPKLAAPPKTLGQVRS